MTLTRDFAPKASAAPQITDGANHAYRLLVLFDSDDGQVGEEWRTPRNGEIAAHRSLKKGLATLTISPGYEESRSKPFFCPFSP